MNLSHFLVPPTLSIPTTMVVLDVKSELHCIAEGFSPPLIYFSWTRAGEVVQLEQAVTAVDRTPEGTYWAVNILKFIPLVDDQNVIDLWLCGHSRSPGQTAELRVSTQLRL